MCLKAEKAIANGSIMHTKMIWMGQGLEIKGMDLLTCLASFLSVYRGRRGEGHAKEEEEEEEEEEEGRNEGTLA